MWKLHAICYRLSGGFFQGLSGSCDCPATVCSLELNSLKEISPGGGQSISLDLMPLFCNRAKYVSCGLANRERVLKLIDDILAIMEKIPR